VKRAVGLTMLVLLFFVAASAAAGWEAAAMAFLIAFGIIVWVAAVILATSNG